MRNEKAGCAQQLFLIYALIASVPFPVRMVIQKAILCGDIIH